MENNKTPVGAFLALVSNHPEDFRYTRIVYPPVKTYYISHRHHKVSICVTSVQGEGNSVEVPDNFHLGNLTEEEMQTVIREVTAGVSRQEESAVDKQNKDLIGRVLKYYEGEK